MNVFPTEVVNSIQLGQLLLSVIWNMGGGKLWKYYLQWRFKLDCRFLVHFNNVSAIENVNFVECIKVGQP